MTPETSLVTGYEFLTDSSLAVRDQLGLGTGTTPDTLINDTWTADQLRAKLLGGPKEDLVYLAGHFDAGAALAADNATTVKSTELLAPSLDLTNTLVFSTGCHTGYNTVDADGVVGVTQADWAQVLARKGATLVAGTGFQYGDDELVEYSERIYAEFAHQLRVGSGPVAVGQALVESKLAYLAATQPKGMHQKALLTASVFGLPMFALNMNGTRDTTPTDGSIVDGTNDDLGVTSADVELDFVNDPENGPAGTTYYSGDDGVASNPGEPALPRFIDDVGVPGQVLRGIGFLRGDFTHTSPVTPFTGAPGTEFGGTQTPFTSTTFYPARMWEANYFGELGDGTTNLVVTPAQHRVQAIGDATAIRRLYSELDLRLFYAGENDDNAALATAPAISDVTATIAGNIVTFAARVHGTDHLGNDNLKSVWVTFTGGAGGCSCWDSVFLTESETDESIWTGTLDIGAEGIGASDLRFIVQAANGAALVGINDNRAAYHSLASTAAGTPAATTLVLNAGPSTGAYGADVTVSATLKQGTTPLSGKVVAFQIGSAFGTGTTNGSGVATATFPLLTLPDALQLVAKYEGDSATAESTDEPLVHRDQAGDPADPGSRGGDGPWQPERDLRDPQGFGLRTAGPNDLLRHQGHRRHGRPGLHGDRHDGRRGRRRPWQHPRPAVRELHGHRLLQRHDPAQPVGAARGPGEHHPERSHLQPGNAGLQLADDPAAPADDHVRGDHEPAGARYGGLHGHRDRVVRSRPRHLRHHLARLHGDEQRHGPPRQYRAMRHQGHAGR